MIDREELISLFLDNKLSGADKEKFKKELSVDKELKKTVEELVKIKQELRDMPTVQTSSNFNAKLLSRIKTLEQEKEQSASKDKFSLSRYLMNIQSVHIMVAATLLITMSYYFLYDKNDLSNLKTNNKQEIIIEPRQNTFADSDSSSSLNSSDKLRGSTHYTGGSKKGN